MVKLKQECEILISKNLCNSISLRYFNPIGSHDSGLIGDCSSDNANNLVPIVTEVACGIRDKLIVNGNDYNTHDGTCIRDYIHVQDLAVAHVKALDFLLDNKVKDVFNVGTGKGLSVLDIINGFQEANDLKLNYEFGPRREGDVEKIYSDGNKTKNILGFNLGSSCMYPANISSKLNEIDILSGKLEPTNEGYAIAKLQFLNSVNLQKEFGFNYKTIIPCNLYGKWDKFDPKILI